MIRVSFRTTTGHFLVANDSSRDYSIEATPRGVGPWEIFTIVPFDRKDSESLRSGDVIHIQTHHARYLRAENGGGGRLTGASTDAIRWETFVIEATDGNDEIVNGSLVTLRANNRRNFVMARNGGGGDVTAESTNREAWEKFSVEFWTPMLVRLKTATDHFVTAQDDGDITATTHRFGSRETFVMPNRTRRTGLHDGDRVGLQASDGRFISAIDGGGGRLTANQDRMGEFETFTIQKDGSGEIRWDESVSLRARNGRNFLMAIDGGGGLVSAASAERQRESTFQLKAAARSPLAFISAQSVLSREHAGHPFPFLIPRINRTQRLICFVIGFQDRLVDSSITREDLKSFFFYDSASVHNWLRTSSTGAFSLWEAGSFAGINVPWPYVVKPDQDYFSTLLQMAEEQDSLAAFPFIFRNLAAAGRRIITGEELLFVVLDCSNMVKQGSYRRVSFTYNGVRYNGATITVGIFSQNDAVLQGRPQLENIFGTLTHQLSRLLFNLPERYHAPSPPRGDVVAAGKSLSPEETFVAVRLVSGGTDGVLSSGEHVYLKTFDDRDYLAFDNTSKRFLNRVGIRSGPSAEFIIEKAGGSSPPGFRDPIRSDDQVHFKSASTGHYLTAKGGGGDVVQVIATRPGPWETFTIEHHIRLNRALPSDQSILKTSNENMYRRSFYLIAEPDGRKTDDATLSRGWWETGRAGDGVGGDYDIMDTFDDRGMHCAYDRIKLGWLFPKVLTPESKGCYVLRPSISFPEVFVLWDPALPDEWYVMEYRQHSVFMDRVPSNGLIISWVNEKSSYWRRWGHNGEGKFPAVISADAHNSPPNSFVNIVLLRDEFYKRSHFHTAFRSGNYTLPRGDGLPSRFHLLFTALSSEQVSVCIL